MRLLSVSWESFQQTDKQILVKQHVLKFKLILEPTHPTTFFDAVYWTSQILFFCPLSKEVANIVSRQNKQDFEKI